MLPLVAFFSVVVSIPFKLILLFPRVLLPFYFILKIISVILRHMHFRRADWDLILFSDECRFNLSHADGRERVYRCWGNACVIEQDRFGGGSVLVWGGIIYSVTLTACAAVSQGALHKMVDTWDTDTFHWIFSLFLLVDIPQNELKPVLLCNCVLQN